MEDNNFEKKNIYSKIVKAGRRTYFFDVKETKAGDYYLTITESKRVFEDENSPPSYKKHKIFLYKEDFNEFKDVLSETTKFIIDEKGEEVISDTHKKDYTPASKEDKKEDSTDKNKFTDVEFDDI